MSADTAKIATQGPSGVVGIFESPETLLVATKKVREANYQNFDAFTPFPVHGLEHAQGLARSPMPYITFGAGLTGAALGFLFQYWTSAVDWPVIVGGKPMNSWPAFVPVMFECTILFAGIFTLLGMLWLNRLPNLKSKIFDPRITSDKFALWIGEPDGTPNPRFKAYDQSEASQLLKTVGAVEVKPVKSEGWFT